MVCAEYMIDPHLWILPRMAGLGIKRTSFFCARPLVVRFSKRTFMGCFIQKHWRDFDQDLWWAPKCIRIFCHEPPQLSLLFRLFLSLAKQHGLAWCKIEQSSIFLSLCVLHPCNGYCTDLCQHAVGSAHVAGGLTMRHTCTGEYRYTKLPSPAAALPPPPPDSPFMPAGRRGGVTGTGGGVSILNITSTASRFFLLPILCLYQPSALSASGPTRQETFDESDSYYFTLELGSEFGSKSDSRTALRKEVLL